MENKKFFVIEFTILMVLILGIVDTDAASNSTSSTGPTNMVVDFDSTTFESNLRAGDSGIMNLVVRNTGGKLADNVQLALSSSASVHVDKNFYIGRVDVGMSKTIPVIVRVESTAKTGLTAIQVQIRYDGFTADGASDDNALTTWEIPFRIYGNPAFQITPSKTTYSKDNVDELELEGVALDSLKDLEVTLSSSCATVIGSSRKYIGAISSNQTFKLTYSIKPTASGACIASLHLSYTDDSGNRDSDNISLGLNVEEAGVDFKVVNVSYAPTGPGETANVKIRLKNVGNANADDTTLSLSLTSPFAPVDSQEKYVGEVNGGQTIDIEFNLAIGWDATTQAYSIPLTITYKVGGTSYTAEKSIGIDVSGKIILQLINVRSSGGSVSIDVANIGTRTADGVKATLITGEVSASDAQGGVAPQLRGSTGQGNISGARSGGGNRSFGGNFTQAAQSTQYLVSYKSDIKPSKQTTFTFTTSASGPAVLTLEYTGLNNQRITQTERITLGASSSSRNLAGTVSRSGGTSITTLAVYGLVVVVVTFVAYKFYKRRKTRIAEATVKTKTPESTVKGSK